MRPPRPRPTGPCRAGAAFGAVLGALASAAPAAAQDPARSVLLANRHLAPLAGLYLSAATDPDWGPDRLRGTALPPGEDATVELAGGCEADLRIVFPSGGAEERRGVDLCASPRVVLRPGWTVAEALDEEGPVAPLPDPGASPTALRLRNAGPLPVVEIYTLPPGSRPGAARGEDRLGLDTLPIGAVIEIEPEDPGACLADLVLVFRDGREVVEPGVDLCAGEEIEVR